MGTSVFKMNLIFTVVLIIFPVFREVSCTCDWPLEHPNLVAATTPDCRDGAVSGKNEQNLGLKTHEECWAAALAVGANGAAIEKVCNNKCWCYAYSASNGWGHGTYLGCIFYPDLSFTTNRERNGVIMRGNWQEKEYDPDFCSKYGTGTEVETYVIDDGEDYYDYKNFAGANMWWGQFIWVTEKPGFFTGNEDPSKPCLKMDDWGNVYRTECNDKAFHMCKLACSEREYVCNGAPPDTPANSYRQSGDNKKITV